MEADDTYSSVRKFDAHSADNPQLWQRRSGVAVRTLTRGGGTRKSYLSSSTPPPAPLLAAAHAHAWRCATALAPPTRRRSLHECACRLAAQAASVAACPRRGTRAGATACVRARCVQQGADARAASARAWRRPVSQAPQAAQRRGARLFASYPSLSDHRRAAERSSNHSLVWSMHESRPRPRQAHPRQLMMMENLPQMPLPPACRK